MYQLSRNHEKKARKWAKTIGTSQHNWLIFNSIAIQCTDNGGSYHSFMMCLRKVEKVNQSSFHDDALIDEVERVNVRIHSITLHLETRLDDPTVPYLRSECPIEMSDGWFCFHPIFNNALGSDGNGIVRFEIIPFTLGCHLESQWILIIECTQRIFLLSFGQFQIVLDDVLYR